jgi:hypothetical protein
MQDPLDFYPVDHIEGVRIIKAASLEKKTKTPRYTLRLLPKGCRLLTIVAQVERVYARS